ncbi:MAG: hypothetical protein Q9196_004205, partial [Gyalolechia fulgens]
MDNFESFDDLFDFDPDYAYSEQIINQIIRYRRAMEDELFIDRLLKTLGIEQGQSTTCFPSQLALTIHPSIAAKLYPPRSNQDLRGLHQHIIDSPSPDHHKQSVLYYILKDIPDKDAHPAATFASAVFLSERYRIFMDGIWLLDRAKFAQALGYLADPVLIPTFPEEILYTLCTHRHQHDDHLPLAYYFTVSPAITSPRVLEIFFSVLARTNVTETFFSARRQGERNHRKLFEILVGSVLDGLEGDDKARRSMELIYLPFSDEEELWFEAYLANGGGKNLPAAGDTLAMRKMVTGRSFAAEDQRKDLGGKKNGGSGWSSSASSSSER